MGKRKNSAVKAPNIAKNATAGGVATFDEQALLALTGKIEKDLHEQQRAGKVENAGAGHQKAARHSRSMAKVDSVPLGLNRGIKRGANGSIKLAGRDRIEDRNAALKQHKEGDVKDNPLLEDILALGGTKEDYELVVGADSDDQGEDSVEHKDMSLQNDLAKFVATLDIEGIARGADDTEIQDIEKFSEAEDESSSAISEIEMPAEGESGKSKASAPTVLKSPHGLSSKEQTNRLVGMLFSIMYPS
jgi:ribosome biogenesis protein MAK21